MLCKLQWTMYVIHFQLALLSLTRDPVPYPFLEHPYYIRALVYVGAVVQAFLSFRFLNSLHS